ncbi:MAG: class I SAM-dependent methyltransferase [Planctomycetota bacterium]
MSVIWQHSINGRNYEVRTAGNSVRLYTNRVFHSQWNSSRPLTNSVWDCLTLPGFFLPPGKPKRVLLMGVGGGAAIRQLQMFFNPDSIVGVELDPVHIEVATHWFGVEGSNVELIEGDAIAWLKSYDGPPFDIVIDDLFGDDDGEAHRALPVDDEWAQHLLKATHKDGLIVVNYEDRTELHQSGLASTARSKIRCRYIFEQETYGNAVGVYVRSQRNRRHWQDRVEQSTVFDTNQRRVALKTWVSLQEK